MTALLAVGVALAAACIDYAAVRHQHAVSARAAHAAACWSVAQFAAAAIGLVAAVTSGWWLLAPEAAGYYAGTLVAVRRLRALDRVA